MIVRIYEGVDPGAPNAEIAWAGDLEELLEANPELPEEMVRSLRGITPGCWLDIGEGFRVHHPRPASVPTIPLTRSYALSLTRAELEVLVQTFEGTTRSNGQIAIERKATEVLRAAGIDPA